LERESYIRSHTALDIFSLNGQVPETIVSGETADISPFALFEWYEWVMYHDTSIPFPEEQLVLGRDLGPAVDIGPAMTRKILKANGQLVYRSTVRHLTPDEWKDEGMKARRQEYDQKIRQLLGDPMLYADLKNDPELADIETPSFEPYDDDEAGT
jgi:hypothetical protein